ncbi:hypothetical protein K456DRAFT_1924345 [Colletotrichum gloeosporioides 23]|nr:hypothetical protein K456DRAFT_1924345 [Colletotrichum gloeosporioides 23]
MPCPPYPWACTRDEDGRAVVEEEEMDEQTRQHQPAPALKPPGQESGPRIPTTVHRWDIGQSPPPSTISDGMQLGTEHRAERLGPDQGARGPVSARNSHTHDGGLCAKVPWAPGSLRAHGTPRPDEVVGRCPVKCSPYCIEGCGMRIAERKKTMSNLWCGYDGAGGPRAACDAVLWWCMRRSSSPPAKPQSGWLIGRAPVQLQLQLLVLVLVLALALALSAARHRAELRFLLHCIRGCMFGHPPMTGDVRNMTKWPLCRPCRLIEPFKRRRDATRRAAFRCKHASASAQAHVRAGVRDECAVQEQERDFRGFQVVVSLSPLSLSPSLSPSLFLAHSISRKRCSETRTLARTYTHPHPPS